MNVTDARADAMAEREPGDEARWRKAIDLGAAAQAAVPGLYAWGVTVAPAAFGHGASKWAMVFALAGVGGLIFFALAEGRLGWQARIAAVWTLLVTSLVTWGIAPSALTVAHMDTVRGVAGMCGWGLFAFTSAAPAIRRKPEDDNRVQPGMPLKARGDHRRSDPLYLAGGIVAAIVLQTIGWSIAIVERALFVRVITLAAGVALIGASADLALARHVRRKRPTAKRSFRRAAPHLLVLVAAVILGIALYLTRTVSW